MGQPPYTATAAQPRWCAETENTADPPYTAHRDRTAQRTATEQHSTAKTEQHSAAETEQHSTAETEQHSTADSRDGAAQQQRLAYAVTQSDLAIL